MLNTTLKEQVFDVPESFLAVLPADFPTTIKIFRSRPTLTGDAQDPNFPAPGHPLDGEVYFFLIVQGSISLFDVLTLNGAISFSAGAGPGWPRDSDRGRGHRQHPIRRAVLRLDRPDLLRGDGDGPRRPGDARHSSARSFRASSSRAPRSSRSTRSRATSPSRASSRSSRRTSSPTRTIRAPASSRRSSQAGQVPVTDAHQAELAFADVTIAPASASSCTAASPPSAISS